MTEDSPTAKAPPGSLHPACSASGKPEMPEAVRKEYNEMIAWINDSGVTLSLLYDLNRLPEQLEVGSREWREMVILVQHMKAAYDEGKASSPNAPHEPCGAKNDNRESANQ